MALFGGQGGAERPDGDHDLCGVYYAIVTQNKFEDSEGAARVKVRYPWLDGGDTDQSFWAQVCVPMCGDQFGTYTLPEVEDTVLVVFIAGDIRYPVVIGGAWSKVDTPPETNEDGKNDFRLIKSRSGHRLLFDDSSSAKLILSDRTDKNMISTGPHGEGGSSDANKYGVGAPPAAGSGATKGVSVNALDGTLNILCPSGTLTIEAKNVEVLSSGAMDVKAGGDVKVKGSTSADFVGTSAGKFEGSKAKIN